MTPQVGDRVVTFRGTGKVLRPSITDANWWVVRIDGQDSPTSLVGWAMRPDDITVIAREPRK